MSQSSKPLRPIPGINQFYINILESFRKQYPDFFAEDKSNQEQDIRACFLLDTEKSPL